MDWQQLATTLVHAWGCWGPALSPDNARIAYVSDRRGTPELWVQAVREDASTEDADDTAVPLTLSADPVTAVRWSADGAWLACAVATGGGVRGEVWLVRPDGRDARRVAGGDGRHATLAPWTHRGARLAINLAPATLDEDSRCLLLDAHTGEVTELARGGLVSVLDLSPDERFALLRDGTRGAHYCVLLDRVADADHPLLPYPGTGSTDAGIVRPVSSDGSPADLVAYLVSDAAQPRPQLVGVPVGHEGLRGPAGTLARRADAELESVSGDDAGRLLALLWNAAGESHLELLDTATRRGIEVPLPGTVVSNCVVSRDGSRVALTAQGPDSPRRIWLLDVESCGLAAGTATQRPRMLPVTAPSLGQAPPVTVPELRRFEADDGLPLTGWLYRPRGATGPGPVVVYLHGGPEAQERPSFEPQHQVLAAAGISVFAPNVRGSSGFGRAFLHADVRYGRYDAITDVRRCVEHLIESGVADPDAVAVAGRSYGGYLTLAALTEFPAMFAAGVDICGMSDLLTFYRDTEPWIAAAAVTKYGDPVHDRQLLHQLSPLHVADRIAAPLLVVHGELDTNVPIGEAHQIVAALCHLGRPVQYLELAGEGHEYRRATSRLELLDVMTAFLLESLVAERMQTAS